MRKQTANKSYNIFANALQYSSHLHQSFRFANSPIPEHFWWVWYIHFSVAHSSTSNHAIRLGREGHQDFSRATYYRMLCVCYVVGCVSQFFFLFYSSFRWLCHCSRISFYSSLYCLRLELELRINTFTLRHENFVPFAGTRQRPQRRRRRPNDWRWVCDFSFCITKPRRVGRKINK